MFTEISVNDIIGLKNISMTTTETTAEISEMTSSMSFITFLKNKGIYLVCDNLTKISCFDRLPYSNIDV